MKLTFPRDFKLQSSLDLLYEKNNEKLVKKRRIKISVFDIINEKKGNRFNKYRNNFRMRIDYRMKKIPITSKISGIENQNIDEYEKTFYCYNNNGNCPFWRYHKSSEIIYCDFLKKTMEIDNTDTADFSALNYFKTYKKIEEFTQPIALFDQVKCCSF